MSGVPVGDLAVVFGSGLSVVPDGVAVVDELGYEELGWPVTGVTGHPSRLLVAVDRARSLRLLLACGRPHLYEGWDAEELARPVRDLAAAGVRGVLLVNAAGGLSAACPPGTAVVATAVVDLQAAPPDEPAVLPLLPAATAQRLVTVLAAHLPAAAGRYVAVAGPQYETLAEAGWLATHGEVVGMSAAPEVRAAREAGVHVALLALVVNRSADATGHDEVLAAGARLTAGLKAVLSPLLSALPFPDAEAPL